MKISNEFKIRSDPPSYCRCGPINQLSPINQKHASNQNAVFEINPGHFKRPFQEPRHGTDSSLAVSDQYLPTFLR